MTDDERQLLSRCFAGDKASWDEFVQRYSRLIYHSITKTFEGHSGEWARELVDDLFQEIFLALVKDDFAQLRRFRGDAGCTLASWLRMIAVRRTIDQLRKPKNPCEPFNERLHDEPTDSSEHPLDYELTRWVANAVEKLAPRERILMDLIFRQGLAAQDVAAILHTSVGAVYTHKSRILAKVRKAIGEAGLL
jgi:RNA polymerase sigma factor (sigma-70 family)